MQRSRSFDAFYDDEGRWELRPTLWIEPIGEWGEGDIRLLEIPAAAEANANIVAQWRPKIGIAAGATRAFAYRQFWCWTPPSKPPLAVCTSSRSGKAGGKPAVCRRNDRRHVRGRAEGRRGDSRHSSQPRQDRFGEAFPL